MQRPSPAIRPTIPGVRIFLYAACGLVLLAGFQLFVLSDYTNSYFAWTIRPPLTAAFLGASYWASFFLELHGAKQREWARARVALVAVLIFATLIATCLHLDRFHHLSPEPVPVVAAWFWFAVYVIVPPLLLYLVIAQLRVAGEDPGRTAPLPDWVRGVLGVKAALLIAVGAALFLYPASAPALWPWQLTPLTARAVAAWLLGIGAFSAHAAAFENDWTRISGGVKTYIVFAVLQLAALARYPDAVQWSKPAAWIYVLFLLSALALGLYGWRTTRALQNR